MKISFLVTFYNQEKYVYDNLESISKIQIPCDYEIIVGDDGSTDNTIEEVEKWRGVFGDHLFIIRSNRDDGITDKVQRASNLRKRLLGHSVGDFFCICDGDDYYCDSSFINEAIALLNKYDSLSLIMHGMNMKYPHKAEYSAPEMQEGRVNSREYIRWHYSPAESCVYRRLYDELFQDRVNRALYYDDNDIVITHLSYGDAWFVNKPVINYRQHDDSIWNSMNRAQQGVVNVIGAENECYLSPNYKNDIIFRYRRDILYSYFRKNNPETQIGRGYIRLFDYNNMPVSDLCTVLFDISHASDEQVKKVEELIINLRIMDFPTYKNVRENVDKERTCEEEELV